MFLFQHTAARRRLVEFGFKAVPQPLFQHTAARRRLGRQFDRLAGFNTFQHTAARRRLAFYLSSNRVFEQVSTHSRPKAAGPLSKKAMAILDSFNTQPPEGGWLKCLLLNALLHSFNTQPPEGGWCYRAIMSDWYPCFNTQPPEGGWFLSCI